MKKDLIFEIGTEEIPARFMNKSLERLKLIAESLFKDNRIRYGEINVYGTPRRLTLYVKDVMDKQEDLEIIKKGPSKKAAYDSDGNPTKALLGFLKGNKFEKDNLSVKDEYLYGKRLEKGNDTIEVLKEILPKVITAINFPKSMKWGNKSFKFVRPVRWLLPIYGDKLVEFDKDGIPCSKITKGHRTLSKEDIIIDNTSEYFDKLREGFVIVDQNERREMIRNQINRIAVEKGGVITTDEELLEEILYLVEYPTAFCGSFDEEFLELPKEVVITPMKEHQRYFPIEDDKGELLNYFIAVRNGDENYINIVKEGNEKVLRARLSDARFFFDEDKKTGLESCVEKLKNVVFQETLGTMYDKTSNIKDISSYLSEELRLSDIDKKYLDRAAYLSKADLVTNMVKEFDELQGIMGKEYALIQGEDPLVAKAIGEYYMPRFAGDKVPSSTVGSLLSISDKIDTIAGCFSIGIQPTGSQDPYALRRQALGIINIILEKSINLSFRGLAKKSLEPFIKKNILAKEESKVLDQIEEFFKVRLKNALLEQGYDYDILDAVLNKGIDDIYDAYLRIKELSKWRKKEEFLNIVGSFIRVSNLAKECKNPVINYSLFDSEEEKTLVHIYEKTKEEFLKAIGEKDYNNALKAIEVLKEPIDNFFDNIMVMVEDINIRNNRLAILKQISEMMNIFADLSIIVVNK
ncbi:MAG: glycine--tRNA ligase subunit beta [Firmicutes bacterium]|nr:glycine--tRNA ligase subunit beta [Bacillota bacterium]